MVIGGIAEFDGALVADRVILYRDSGGRIDSYVGEQAPGVGSAYSFDVPDIGPYHVKIVRAGQLPLMHGPINAI